MWLISDVSLGFEANPHLRTVAIREGKSPDDKKTLHFLLNFLQISTIFASFSQAHAGTLQNPSICPCATTLQNTQWNHLLYFTAIPCYASIGSIKFSGNPHNYCCYT
jgi:hypothetical protein